MKTKQHGMIKTQQEIEQRIAEIEKGYHHVLTGSVATVAINAPRALMQLDAEAKLTILHWALGTQFKSKLKGFNR